MYESLIRHSSDFHLYIFSFDEQSDRILEYLGLEKATVISLKEFETNDLREAKQGRSIAEYCWTCTPSTISYVFQNFNVPHCTYIDADLCFYSDPSVLISELLQYQKSVLITEHRYSLLARLYEEARAGRFCVQFITFFTDDKSLQVLEKWRKQCINWCFARHEDGKFGDQKYLDDWPESYPNVHILQHEGGGIAPWNLTKYSFSKENDSIKGRVKNTGSIFTVIFFHFQYVKFHKNGVIDIGWYLIPSIVRKLFYSPYLADIEAMENRLKAIPVNYTSGYSVFSMDSMRNKLKTRFKKLLRYNLIKKSEDGLYY